MGFAHRIKSIEADSVFSPKMILDYFRCDGFMNRSILVLLTRVRFVFVTTLDCVNVRSSSEEFIQPSRKALAIVAEFLLPQT